MKVSNVSIKLEIVVEHPKTRFTTSKMYCSNALVKEGRYQRAVREAATDLLKMIREEGLEPQTSSAEIPGAIPVVDVNCGAAAFPTPQDLSPTVLLLPSSSV